MTPAQVEEQARRRYNAYGSSFYSQDELFQLIYEAEMILATEANVIEAKDTSISTVAGTQAYTLPSDCLSLKRVEISGYKLKPIDQREDDMLTLNNASTTTQGTPQYYWLWSGAIYLRPIPDSVATVTLYQYELPAALTTSSSTLSVPTRCHIHLCDYLLSVMTAKDENFEAARYFQERWEQYLEREKMFTQKRKRTDGFATVKDEDSLADTILGFV